MPRGVCERKPRARKTIPTKVGDCLLQAERQKIAVLLQGGITARSIAERFGCSVQTIYRIKAQIKREDAKR